MEVDLSYSSESFIGTDVDPEVRPWERPRTPGLTVGYYTGNDF